MSQQTMHIAPMSADCVTARLRIRLNNYEGLNGSGEDLTLVKEVHRRFCNLYLYRLSAESNRPSLVVKVPIGHGDVAYKEKSRDSSFVDRPRLFGRADPASKSRNEYAALRRIEANFGNQDPRFGSVRIYDMFPEEQAMVMQWIDQPSLRQLVYQMHWFGNAQRAKRLEIAFVHVGAWLRKHHELPSLGHCETRNTSRDDYLQAIERFASYLADRTGNPRSIDQIHRQIVSAAQDHLPSVIPTGQVHGDYAPRNIFIDQANRVTVFDTLGRFEAPVFEDIAKLLMTVKASGPQLLSGGLLYNARQLRRYEQSFLEGYFFDQPIPYTIVRLFEAQLLLEHWAATVYRHQEGRGLRRIAKGLRRTIWQAGFKSYLQEVLADISTDGQNHG